jgi:hypothetical protein
MLKVHVLIAVLVPALVAHATGCDPDQGHAQHENGAGVVAGSGESAEAGMPRLAEGMPRSGPGSAHAGQTPVDSASADSSTAGDFAPKSMPLDASAAANGTTTDAGPPASETEPRSVTADLSEKSLAMWGSSVCDGFSVPSGTGWPWTVEKRLAEIKGPKVLHVSTSGHATDSKESSLERSKIESADFVIVCLSLGNQGLGSAATEQSAQAVVDSYLDDIFTDDNDRDGDPVSLVNYIKSRGAYPIVTLVYPMAGYTTMHCQHVVQANILQQAYGIATVNHLGSTNAGNNFGDGDCTWANGRNAPVNVESDARHPTRLGHDENFYAFPPDLPFALASAIPFPVRPETTDYLSLSQNAGTGQAGGLRLDPIRYTPEHAMHNYTMQFAFQASSDGTLAAVDLGMNGFLSIELNGGAIRVVAADGSDALRGAGQVTPNEWHDVAITYSHVRQKLALYVDGALVGEHDSRQGSTVRELFPKSFILGGPGASGRPAAPAVVQLRDFFINRTSLHAMEVKERATTAWVGAGSLDVYAPLRAAVPAENRAQTLQMIKVQL